MGRIFMNKETGTIALLIAYSGFDHTFTMEFKDCTGKFTYNPKKFKSPGQAVLEFYEEIGEF